MNNVLIEKDLEELNKKYDTLSVYQRVEKLYEDFDEDDIMLTSSFAATSAFLLKVFSDVHPTQLIYFIDTGYHFRETLIYKEYLTKLYDLNVVSVIADQNKHEETKSKEMWNVDPNKCCFYNKVEPMDYIKKEYNVWVSGLMKWQSDYRSSLNYFEPQKDIVKFYPLLDIDFEGRDAFIRDHHLPFHPLKSKGYNSIGCTHCTVPGEG